ncbi:MAG: VIT1/CCC1 transporter family protein [Nanoarchaeota archaeon]
MKIKKFLIRETKLTIKDWVFGGEDGLMVTFGAVLGMSAAVNENSLIILTGLLVMLSNAISMAAGSYLSTKSQAQVLKHEEFKNPVLSAAVMFIACLFGAIIVIPFLFLNIQAARILSIVLTILALFGIGIFRGRLTKRSWIKSGFEMVIVAMIAGIVSYFIGRSFAL